MIIGITGLTGSGKSYLTNLIEYHYRTYTDVKILDCDDIYHNLIKPELPCWKELKETFGDKIIDPITNEINRKILADIIFKETFSILTLNLITWKYVREAIEKEIENLDSRDVCIIDCPLLFPSKMDNLCDKILITEASYTKRMTRIIARDKINSKQAFDRIHSQPIIDQIGENILRINTNDGISENKMNTIIKFIGE